MFQGDERLLWRRRYCRRRIAYCSRDLRALAAGAGWLEPFAASPGSASTAAMARAAALTAAAVHRHAFGRVVAARGIRMRAGITT